MPLSTVPRTAATDLLDALARRDFTQLAGCFSDDVRFRALLPSGPCELTGPAEVAERFRSWFGQDDELLLLDSDVAKVGSKVRLRWRVQVASTGHRPRFVEQTVLAAVGERIEALDLLCSGWQLGDE